MRPAATEGPFHGWVRPGPAPPGGAEVEPGETLDFLSGRWRIFQYEDGHRFSTDDLLVAWYGTQWAPRVARALDLGSGIGSVALTAAWRLPGATFVTVEAQERSARLARKSVAYDGVAERFRIVVGDLRDPEVLAGEAPFDLVLGAPPYFPEGTATPAAHPQAQGARLELRGSIGDYARAAAPHLAPGGHFVCVFPVSPAAQRERAVAALHDAGLALVRTRDVVFREGEPAMLSLFASVRGDDVPAHLVPFVEPPLVIRRRDGSRHPEWAAIRLSLGFPPGPPAAEALSP